MRIVARWESRSKKWYVELYQDQYGYAYKAVEAGGSLGIYSNDAAAIATMQARIHYMQPDANTTPMRRVL